MVRYCTVKFTKYSDDIKWALKHLEKRKFPEPVERKDITNDKVRERIFEKMIDLWMVRQEAYDNAKSSMFEVIWTQCSQAMQSKIESNDYYENMVHDNDCVNIL